MVGIGWAARKILLLFSVVRLDLLKETLAGSERQSIISFWNGLLAAESNVLGFGTREP